MGRFGIALLAAACAIAVSLPQAQGAPERGGSATYVTYAGIKKVKKAPPDRRFTVRLFTNNASPKHLRVVAANSGERADATFTGRNHGFEEWVINAKQQDGRRLIRSLRRELNKRDRATFGTAVTSSGAVGDSNSKCKVKRFNEVYGCEDILEIQPVP